MRCLQKLVRNGNSTGVNFPRALLFHIGWLPGEMVIVELLEDQSLRLRRPTAEDFAPKASPRLVLPEKQTASV